MGNSRFKFRIWDKFCETWLTDFAINQDGEINKFFNSEEALKRRFVLMQSTGLKDKNGKLIYEGDIIKCSYGFEYYIGVVVWDKQCIQFSMSVDKELYSFNQRSEYDKIEIIGNIYQNKELLNE